MPWCWTPKTSASPVNSCCEAAITNATAGSIDILHTNIYRYLWAERSDGMLALSQHRDPDEWLTEQLTQARHWNWSTPEQLHFLVLHRLETLERPVIKNWSPREHETPQTHFERLLSEVQFWAGATPV